MNRYWTDAHLSAGFATWLAQRFSVEATSVHVMGLSASSDKTLFEAARAANAIVITKDRDFIQLLDQHGPPPKIVWLTFGNTSERQ